jgi:multicomponent Na+:H+ antiporter subunit E
MTIAILRRFAIFFALWLVIAWQEALVVGAIAAGVATIVSLRLLPAQHGVVRLVWLVRGLPGFFWASFLGGVDVIWRAFHPRLPLNPGWIVYRSRLPTSAARVALGSDLSLMPGTLAAGTRGQALYVHCLDVDRAVDRQIAREERRIGQSLADD